MQSFPDLLVVFALQLESQDVFAQAGVPVLFCGVGKVNAAIALTRRLGEYRCAQRPMPRVVNFGSAGSSKFTTGTTVACNAFVQRDMDVTGLGFSAGVTPYEDIPMRLEFPPMFAGLPHGVCGTGDSFQMGTPAPASDVVDMEAYALAKVCWMESAQFGCVKYITDGADHAAAKDWRDNLHKAADAFLHWYRWLERNV